MLFLRILFDYRLFLVISYNVRTPSLSGISIFTRNHNTVASYRFYKILKTIRRVGDEENRKFEARIAIPRSASGIPKSEFFKTNRPVFLYLSSIRGIYCLYDFSARNIFVTCRTISKRMIPFLTHCSTAPAISGVPFVMLAKGDVCFVISKRTASNYARWSLTKFCLSRFAESNFGEMFGANLVADKRRAI